MDMPKVTKDAPSETEVLTDAEAPQGAEGSTEAGAADAAPKSTTSKKDARPTGSNRKLPDGFITPVEAAKVASQIKGDTVPPQHIYGSIRNSKAFNAACVVMSDEKDDANPNGRPIINKAKFVEWYTNKVQAKTATPATATPASTDVAAATPAEVVEPTTVNA